MAGCAYFPKLSEQVCSLQTPFDAIHEYRHRRLRSTLLLKARVPNVRYTTHKCSATRSKCAWSATRRVRTVSLNVISASFVKIQKFEGELDDSA
jgi:hypothetical protein